MEHYRVDPDRVYITGFSASVIEAYRYITEHPQKVAGFVSVSGSRYWDLCRMKDVPLWAFHNLYDSTITSDKSVRNVAEINRCPPAVKARMTMYEKEGHDAWTWTYSGSGRGKEMAAYDPFNESIFDWFLHFTKPQPLYANAGENKTITLPENKVVLQGGSNPSANVSYLWTQLQGPNQALLSNQTTVTLTASNLVQGVYEFALTATDAQQNKSTDMVRGDRATCTGVTLHRQVLPDQCCYRSGYPGLCRFAGRSM